MVQRIYEYLRVADKEVSTRELVTAFSDVPRSTVTFALTRLVREGEVDRLGHGRYRAAGPPEDAVALSNADDAFLAQIFETVRPLLRFQELVFLYEVVNVARRLLPEEFRKARERVGRGPDQTPSR